MGLGKIGYIWFHMQQEVIQPRPLYLFYFIAL